jgi:hypothetical protein
VEKCIDSECKTLTCDGCKHLDLTNRDIATDVFPFCHFKKDYLSYNIRCKGYEKLKDHTCKEMPEYYVCVYSDIRDVGWQIGIKPMKDENEVKLSRLKYCPYCGEFLYHIDEDDEDPTDNKTRYNLDWTKEHKKQLEKEVKNEKRKN